MQDIVVFCLDVTPSMNLDPLHGGDTPLGMSLQIARQLVQKRVIIGQLVFTSVKRSKR